MVWSQLEAFLSKVKYLHTIKLKIKAFAEETCWPVYTEKQEGIQLPCTREQILGMLSPSHEFLDSRETDRLPTGEFPSRFPEDFVRGLDRKAITQVVILWRRRLLLRCLPLDHLVTLLPFSVVPSTEKIHSPTISIRAGLPGLCAASDLLLASSSQELAQPASR